jgi:hypothetical protein
MNKKEDIGQCLDIQRLESNRKDAPPAHLRVIPGSAPGGILNQENLKKPQTAGGGFRHNLVRSQGLH